MEPVHDFDVYGPGMMLYRPSVPSDAERDSAHPTLIVFCTFMGATRRIIDKYCTGYMKLFPHSSILLIRSNVKDTFALDKAQLHRTELASATILDIKASTPGPILLHAMSNGGTIAAARIAQYLHDMGNPNDIFTNTIVDCAPSRPQLGSGTEAMIMQFKIKSRILKWLCYWSLYISMGTLMFLWCTILRKEDMVQRLRRRWNDSKLFNNTAARMYLFSKSDKLIPYRDVQDHAEDARRKGWKDVREELFEKAAHCALIMEDSARYWGTIERLVLGERLDQISHQGQ